MSQDAFEQGHLLELLKGHAKLAQALPHYEHREQQIAMLQGVFRAFAKDLVLLVEAGTGVGKSLAYGLPAALFALCRGQRVVLSTGTINLQEQLVGKDLPLVAQLLDRVGSLKVELAKGRANYLCRRRLQLHLAQGDLIEQDPVLQDLRALVAWAKTTTDGSRKTLPRALSSAAWDLVCSDSDACLSKRCSYRENCFFARARARLEDAHILVVNHHLLFADLALRLQLDDWQSRAVLPAFDRVVLDEGHTVDAIATGFFGLQLTRIGVLRTLGSLAHQRKASGGLLLAVQSKLDSLRGSEALGAHRPSVLVREVEQTRQTFESAFAALGELISSGSETGAGSRGSVFHESRLRLQEQVYGRPEWVSVRESLQQAAAQCHRLSGLVNQQRKRLQELTEAEHQALEMQSVMRRLEDMGNACLHWIAEEQDEDVRWVERAGQQKNQVRIQAACLDVATKLRQTLLEQMSTVVITSATLAVRGSFDYYKERLGLQGLDKTRLCELQLSSPFDFERQALLVVPTDGPLPTQAEFGDWLHQAIVRLNAASRGGSLVLFTAWGQMSRAYECCYEPLCDLGLEPLCQGQESRDRLLQNLRDNAHAVLFGTDSFWQGIDVIGQALRQVIVCRLPFDVPTDPVVQARAERIQASHRSPFNTLLLPRAVIKLKQGFGRLIRSTRDTGAVVVLDRRLVDKSYGKAFRESLPPIKTLSTELDQVCEHLAGFFDDSQSE